MEVHACETGWVQPAAVAGKGQTTYPIAFIFKRIGFSTDEFFEQFRDNKPVVAVFPVIRAAARIGFPSKSIPRARRVNTFQRQFESLAKLAVFLCLRRSANRIQEKHTPCIDRKSN